MMKCVHNERKIMYRYICKLFFFVPDYYCDWAQVKEEKKSKALDIDGCVWMENFKGGLKESKVNEWVRWKEEENIGNEKWERKASEQCREYQES